MIRLWLERRLPPAFVDLLPDGVQIVAAASDTPQSPLAMIGGAHAIVASSRIQYNAALMDAAKELRVISRTGMGIENIDLTAATARGIAVCNAPDGPTVSTAEHALALLLAVAKQLKRSENQLRGTARIDYFNESRAMELFDRHLGLVGLGRIGGHLARMVKSIGMKVMAFDPYVERSRAEQIGIQLADSLDQLLSWADVLSLHVPSTDTTRGMINAGALAKMKRGSILINCARGDLVDERALLEALESGQLAGAGLDVFQKEPPPPDHPLLAREDVVATPHIAAATVAGKKRLWMMAINQAVGVCRGERPPHLVNPDAWRPGESRGMGSANV